MAEESQESGTRARLTEQEAISQGNQHVVTVESLLNSTINMKPRATRSDDHTFTLEYSIKTKGEPSTYSFGISKTENGNYEFY